MKNIWLLVVAIGISCLLAGLIYLQIPKTAFVDNHQLFEAFQGRKELENRLEKKFNECKSNLDSLALKIQSIQNVTTKDEATMQQLYFLQQQYAKQNQTHQELYQVKSQEYTEAIWKQISQYTLEYGAQNGYDYIFGIAGQGTLMYGKPQYDITEDVIKYVNSKYAGN